MDTGAPLPSTVAAVLMLALAVIFAAGGMARTVRHYLRDQDTVAAAIDGGVALAFAGALLLVGWVVATPSSLMAPDDGPVSAMPTPGARYGGLIGSLASGMAVAGPILVLLGAAAFSIGWALEKRRRETEQIQTKNHHNKEIH